MATQTEKLRLNIWEAEDTVTMEGFNQNNLRLEEKLGSGARELIMDVTTQEAANAVSLPMAGIDWTKYDYVYVDYLLQTAKLNGAATYVKWRINGSTADSDGLLSMEAGDRDLNLYEGCVGYHGGSTKYKLRLRFNVMGYPDNRITLVSHCYDGFYWGYSETKFSGFSTLTVAATDSTVNILEGSNFKVWGVRA